jgi:RNA ligase
MRVEDLFDPSELQLAVDEGMVRVQFHPLLPLAIACYTTGCVIAHQWNEVTTACRGLVYNYETHEILARPFPKFFNLGEPLAREDYEAEVEVTDKLDGSLGIGYAWEGKLYIATKGSFASDQSIEANKILQETHPDWLPPEGVTPLFEIIYPENRIVLDYGESRELRLLEGIDIETGKTFDWGSDMKNRDGIWMSWPGRTVGFTGYTSLREVVSAIPRENAEGFVVRYLDTDERVKIKQPDYLAKHKLVFNLSQRTIWQSLLDCKFHDYKAGMPDEFHEWMDTEAEKYWKKFDDYMSIVHDCVNDPDLSYLIACAWEGDRYARLMIAEMIGSMPGWLEGTIWCIVDGYDYHRLIFKQFEPKGQTKVAKP